MLLDPATLEVLLRRRGLTFKTSSELTHLCGSFPRTLSKVNTADPRRQLWRRLAIWFMGECRRVNQLMTINILQPCSFQVLRCLRQWRRQKLKLKRRRFLMRLHWCNPTLFCLVQLDSHSIRLVDDPRGLSSLCDHLRPLLTLPSSRKGKQLPMDTQGT